MASNVALGSARRAPKLRPPRNGVATSAASDERSRNGDRQRRVRQPSNYAPMSRSPPRDANAPRHGGAERQVPRSLVASICNLRPAPEIPTAQRLLPVKQSSVFFRVRIRRCSGLPARANGTRCGRDSVENQGQAIGKGGVEIPLQRRLFFFRRQADRAVERRKRPAHLIKARVPTEPVPPLTRLIHGMAGIRWRVSRKALIGLADWVSTPSGPHEHAEPHPPWPTIRSSRSAFQPSPGRNSPLPSMVDVSPPTAA